MTDIPRMLGVLAEIGFAPQLVTLLAEFGEHHFTLDERRFIEGPLVLHQSAWNDTLPEWVKGQVRAERVELVLTHSPMIVGPTEIMAVMYGAMMDAPRDHDCSQLYLWGASNAAARHYRRDIADIWRTLNGRVIKDRDVIYPSGRLYHVYAPFASEIRRKVIAHAPREPKPDKATPAKPAKAIKAEAFDLFSFMDKETAE